MELVYTNAASVRTKWPELMSRPECKMAAVVAISETWLTTYEHIPKDVTDEFFVYRQDRQPGARGGGCAILVRQEYNPVDTGMAMSTRNVNMITIGLCVQTQKVILVCVYRGPGSTPIEDLFLFEKLDACRAYAQRMVIMGDFNFPEIEWATENALLESPGKGFLDWMHGKALFQHISSPTRFRGNQKPSLLDLIISSNEGDVSNLKLHAPLGKSDHCVIILRCT